MKLIKIVPILLVIILINLFAVIRTTPTEGDTSSLTVILYHHLLPHDDISKFGWSKNDSVLSVENFEEQMRYLADNNYYTASLSELEKFLNDEISLPEKTVVITFDDGYLSNAVYAYPIMQEYGFRGVIFMVGNTASREQEAFSPVGTQHISLPTFNKYSDVFEFGCHTYNMHYLKDGVPAVQLLEEEEIRKDLNLNKSIIKTNYIAYPFGAYNETILKVIDELGYTLGFNTKHDYVRKDTPIYEIPRFSINPDTTLREFEKIISVNIN